MSYEVSIRAPGALIPETRHVVLSILLTASGAPEASRAVSRMTFFAKSLTWYNAFHTGSWKSSFSPSARALTTTCAMWRAASCNDTRYSTCADSSACKEQQQTRTTTRPRQKPFPITLLKKLPRAQRFSAVASHRFRRTRHWKELRPHRRNEAPG